ncbi:uncharacterized protein DNG_10003 [Cephalotrichum gorgonifer]|uniref:Nephrocystin 3-like N-terminal domain-containing protein n=1 Tax=Cephalotrichum gorgonifer TaxID=2041049 RepID=A0AAE8N848_9PEZI|nr:uncharacterized protein DNG_10003 [Cephalotrichum gorgonifer]
MANNRREQSGMQPAQLKPVADEASVPGNYWKQAYESLDQEIRDRVTRLKQRFDDDTETAIRKLIQKASDDEVKRKLREIAEVPRQSDTRVKGALDRFGVGAKGKQPQLDIGKKLQRLDVREKGELQRLAWVSKKRLDDETIHIISTIHEACITRPNEDFDKNKESFVSVETLLELCGERQKIAKEKSWRFNFLGEQYVVHELWGSVVKKINKLKTIVDVAASSDPTANIVWSAIKVILQFATQGEEEAGAVLAGIDLTVDAIQRGRLFEDQVQTIRVGNERAQPDTCIEVFEKCLISTYGRILEFLSEAGASLEKSHAGLCWHAFWNHETIAAFEHDIFKFEQQLFQDAMTKSVIYQTGMIQRLGDLASTLLDAIRQSQQLEDEILLAKDRDRILGWLSDSKIKDHHGKAQKLREATTGFWVFEIEEYKRWSVADGPRLLWITGIPGAGKTVLTSNLIDHHLESRTDAPDVHDFQLAYFYCNASDRRFSHDVFRSFIRQLADGYHPLPERLCQLYKDKSRRTSKSVEIEYEDYRDLLMELIPTTTETILILDALDECIGNKMHPDDPDEEMEEVLRMFRELLDSNLPVKLIVSSRHDRAIATEFRDQGVIKISSDDNLDDILTMVKGQIDKYNENAEKRMKKKIEGELRDRIFQFFRKKSRGILFFDRIEKLYSTDREAAHRVFCWLLASKGSCEKAPLLAAIYQKMGGDPHDQAGPSPVDALVDGDGGTLYVLEICENLVVLDGSVFRFSHLSVQEYLESDQPKFTQDCHYDVALVCTWMVFRYETQKHAVRCWAKHHGHHPCFPAIDGGQNELYMYDLWEFAANRWHNHFQQIKDETQKQKIREIVLGSFSNNAHPVDSTIWLRLRAATIVETWQSSRDVDKAPVSIITLASQPINWVDGFSQSRDLVFPSDVVPIQAILSGVLWKTRHLLHGYLADEPWCRELQCDVQNALYSDSEDFESTSESRRFTLAPRLITHLELIDYKVQAEELATLLRMLSHFEDHKQHPIDRLLDPYCSLRHLFNEPEPYDRKILEELARLTLLMISAGSAGTSSSVKLNTYEQMFVTQLLKRFPNASRVQYHHLVPTVEFLDWSGVLVNAAGSLEPGLLEILISHGADVNVPTPSGSALISAISSGSLENMQFLLKQGADVNLKCHGATHGTALIAGCALGHGDVVKALLDIRGIEVSTVVTPGKYATALIAACAHGQVKIVKQLLLRSALVNETVEEGRYSTALFAAVDAGCIRAVRLLLKNGAREVPGAVEGRWRRDGVVRDTATVEDYNPIQSDCQSLVEWLALGLIRGIQDDQEGNGPGIDELLDQNIKEEDTVQALADDDKEDRVERGESDESDQPTDSNANDPVTETTRRLNRPMSFNSWATSQALIEAFGFSPYEHRDALANGFQAMLQHTDGEDWHIVRDAWSEFLDLAEEAEETHISDPLLDKLAKAEVRAVDVRVVEGRPSRYDPEPPTDGEGDDWDWEEGDDGGDEHRC